MNIRSNIRWGLAALLLGTLPTLASAQEWGTLTGQFILKGKAPEPKFANPSTANDAFCQQLDKIPLDQMVVGPNGELANVVVYVSDRKVKAVHPSYEESANASVEIDNKDCRFQPHVVVMRTSQTLVIKNSDPTPHNSRITPLLPQNPARNPILPANQSFEYKFRAQETQPVKVTCSIHPWMTGHIVVRNNPYAAVSDEEGKFTIENLPVGEIEFRLKHADSKYIAGASVGGGKTSRRGQVKITIKPGMNDLGQIEVSNL